MTTVICQKIVQLSLKVVKEVNSSIFEYLVLANILKVEIKFFSNKMTIAIRKEIVQLSWKAV